MHWRAMDDPSLKLTGKEITTTFSDPIWSEKFPPVLTIEQAASLLQVPVGTLRGCRSRGLLGTCSRRVGKHVRFFRDRFITLVFNGNFLND
jgi:hypothetical protein